MSWLQQHAAAPFTVNAMQAMLVTDSRDEVEFHKSLRNLRRHAMLHCIYRDINGRATLDEIVGGMLGFRGMVGSSFLRNIFRIAEPNAPFAV